MLEEAILEARAGGIAVPRDAFSPQISVDAPILISDEYVPDLDLRMGLYRRMNELENTDEIESFAAEMIDRFGKLPEREPNLLKVIEIKLNCRKASVAKLDVGPKGALVHFHNDSFPDLEGLLAYVERLKGAARLRPDSKLVIARSWPNRRFTPQRRAAAFKGTGPDRRVATSATAPPHRRHRRASCRTGRRGSADILDRDRGHLGAGFEIRSDRKQQSVPADSRRCGSANGDADGADLRRADRLDRDAVLPLDEQVGQAVIQLAPVMFGAAMNGANRRAAAVDVDQRLQSSARDAQTASTSSGRTLPSGSRPTRLRRIPEKTVLLGST